MNYIFYYLTEDSENIKERNEINYLRAIGRVVVVTRGNISAGYKQKNIKTLNLQKQPRSVIAAYFLWTKICYLLSRSSESKTDKGFPLRNIYTGNIFVRKLINFLWPIKYNVLVKKVLPSYESLYFAPFRFTRLLVQSRNRSDKRFKRVIVHDALFLRLTRFTTFILAARQEGAFTLANIKSWDNPYYSQFVQGANGYLTWSKSMWEDVRRLHQVGDASHHVWGPRPFYNFAKAVQYSERRPNSASGESIIGYAAAFCDVFMAEQEVRVIAGIAEGLLKAGSNVKILFRPYPIVPISVYETLANYSNIEIVNIKGLPSDRYGDGREMIRFGSDEERILYLSRCHCFLSIATSFTFEAVIFGMPVIQYYLPLKNRNSVYEKLFYERLDISDHILNYLLTYFPVVNNPVDLAEMVEGIRKSAVQQESSSKILEVMGFTSKIESWDDDSGNLLKNLKLA